MLAESDLTLLPFCKWDRRLAGFCGRATEGLETPRFVPIVDVREFLCGPVPVGGAIEARGPILGLPLPVDGTFLEVSVVEVGLAFEEPDEGREAACKVASLVGDCLRLADGTHGKCLGAPTFEVLAGTLPLGVGLVLMLARFDTGSMTLWCLSGP